MRPVVFSGLLGLGAILVACGGGGGSHGGGYTPPGGGGLPVSYAARLIFLGALDGTAGADFARGSGGEMQADLRRVPLQDDDTQTPEPIMIVSPLADESGEPCLGSTCYGAGQGYVEAIVSPMPSVTPSVTFTQNAAHVVLIAQPTQDPLPANVIAEVNAGSDGTLSVQSAGTATATIGDPIDEAPTTQVYQYFAINADCVSNDGSSGGAGGWYWTGSAWSPTNTVAQADIYVTNSNCTSGSPYTVADDTGTLHFPGGGVLLSTDNPFYSLTASQWTNVSTSASIVTMLIPNGDGSVNAELIAKTQNGLVFKVFPNGFGGTAGSEVYYGAVEVSGAGIDGF